MPSSPAVALPIASGSQCSSNWVNNEGALNCFIQGEEETRNGAKHPHYVACAGGDVFCCVDDDRGAQDCVAQARAKPANNADRLRAILAAHRTMLMRLGRYYSRPDGLPTKTPNSPRKAPP
ncbi:MAG TPA: hypothetical protein VGF07_09455 [Stellaceae bacterium]|jgi:hypothetical protein